MEAKIDAVLSKMETGAEKVELYCNSKVKLPMAELDYLKTLEDARDFMTMMVTKTSDNRQQLADIFGGDCSRIARIRTVLDGVKLSDMNCNDQRVRTCTEACATIEKVLEDMGLGWCLKKACDEQKANLGRRRSSVDREAAMVAAQAAQAQAEALSAEVVESAVSEATPVVVEEPPAKASKAADEWARCFDEDFVKRVLACTEATELHALEKEAVASKSSKIGNWMIWMVHRAHLDDPTLVKFDFTNLKMPDGNVEPLVSPKLAVAMESNTHIENLLLGCTNLQDQEAAILAVSLRSNSSLKVLNIDTNAIQPLTLESIANGTSVNQALQELRCNNTATGRLVTEAFLNALKSNPMMCKLGFPVTDPYFRGEIDKQLTRNNDAARKRRVEERKRREAEAEAGGSPPSTQSAAPKPGYPVVKTSPKAASWPPKLAAEAQPKEAPEEAPKEVVASESQEEKAPEKAAETPPEPVGVPVEKEETPVEPPEAAPDSSPAAEEPVKPEMPKEEEAAPAEEKLEAAPEAAAPKEADPAPAPEEKAKEAEAPEPEPAAKDKVDAPPMTLESFLTNEGSSALPGMVDAPSSAPDKETVLSGYLYKKSPSARLLKSWDWRFFLVQNRRLVWWRRETDVPAPDELTQPDPLGCKGFVDFALSSARVVPDEKNPAVFALEAVDGSWKEGSLKDMSDAQRTFEFDCTNSAHTRDEWIRALSAQA